MNIKLAKKRNNTFYWYRWNWHEWFGLIMKVRFLNSGSDILSNKNIDRLKKKIRIYLDQSSKNLKNATIVVISSAIKRTT